MSPSGRELALIVGHYKAGSTWLLRLLCMHPQIRGLGETHIFHHVLHAGDLAACTRILFSGVPWSAGGQLRWPLYRLQRLATNLLRPGRNRLGSDERPATLLDLNLREQRHLRRALEQCRLPQEYCRVFFDHLHNSLRPRDYLLEKTPANIRYVPFIREIFPEARLLAIYRDGRDVCVSDRFFRARRGESWSFDDSVARWRAAMEAQQRYEKEYGLFTLSYETLLRDGRRVVAGLLRFLELNDDPELAQQLVERSSFESVTGRSRGAEDRSSFNRKGIIGDWRNHFSQSNRDTFKRLANDVLVSLGYEQDDSW